MGRSAKARFTGNVSVYIPVLVKFGRNYVDNIDLKQVERAAVFSENMVCVGVLTHAGSKTWFQLI